MSRRIIVGLAAVIAVTGAAGVASAAWYSVGNGTATATATTAQPSSILPVAPVAVDHVYPGAVKTSLVTITNPNPYPVKVTSISAAQAPAVSGCPANTVSTAGASDAAGLAQVGGSDRVVEANTSGTFSIPVSMIANADNSCQGDTFTLTVSAAIESAA